MANSLTISQAVTVLNSLISQMQGGASLAATDVTDFVSVAETALKTGFDPVLGAISQVLDHTIFAIRPYYAKFKAMEKTNAEYGAWTRKINYCDRPFVQDDGFNLTDGTSLDPWVIRHPDTIQLNITGQEVVEDYFTRTEDQMKLAFRGPDEFGQFWAGVLQNLSDKHEQKTEAIARANLMNAIGAIAGTGGTEQTVHLLTEYNTILTAAGKTALTNVTVYDPDNYSDFMKWVYSRIQTVRDFMTERSINFHLNVTNASKYIQRHTPYNRQILYMYAPELRQMEARVLSAAFNEGRLAYKDIELVNYWQSIETPTDVNVKYGSIDADGEYDAAASATTVSNIFALLVDDDAMGYTRYSDGMYATPINARGRYTNFWYHWRWMQYCDMTENMVLFTLD